MQRINNAFVQYLRSNSFKNYRSPTVSVSVLYHRLNRCFSQAVKNYPSPNGISDKKRFNVEDLIQYVNTGKVFYLKQLINVYPTIEFDKLNSEQAKLLLELCGSSVVDSSCDQRNALCQKLYEDMTQVNKVTIDVLNRYIKTCTENKHLVPCEELLGKWSSDVDTYKLLFENASEVGAMSDMFKILELMKQQNIGLDGDIVKHLVLGHVIQGGLKSAHTVLSTLRSAQIFENNDVKLAIFKGLIRRGNYMEFKKAVEIYPIQLTGDQLLSFIEEMGLNGLESWLAEIKGFYSHVPISRTFQIDVERLCIHLIHMDQPVAAMNIYAQFVGLRPNVSFGWSLLKEMLHSEIDIATIISLAKNISEKEMNPCIMESLSELALKFKYEKQAWALLKNLDFVRPHYFWPLLVENGRTNGEIGIFSTLTRIKEFNVNLDADTLEFYVLPNCDLSNCKLLLLKLENVGFTVHQILSPLLVVLLKQNETKMAAELCSLYNVNISREGFLRLLAKSWSSTKDSSSVLVLLARYCESNQVEQDLVGSFLIQIVKLGMTTAYFSHYLALMKLIRKQRLKVTNQSAYTLQDICKPFITTTVQKEFDSIIASLVDLALNLPDSSSIIHPKNMNLDELECHLIELREKNMEIRGVLRKLIQLHAGNGKVQRVKELRELFRQSGYSESAGMKSAIMHSYIVGEQLDEAINLYDELKLSHPDFKLDNYKIIDLVKLLVENNRFNEGVSIINEQSSKSKQAGNIQAIQRNCRALLKACKTEEQVEEMFALLMKNGLCVACNVTLGPLIEICLKTGQTGKAVERYIELSQKYKCTPFQLEILKAVSKEQNSAVLDRLLKATEAVHGSAAAQLGLIAALAENGQQNALRNALLNMTRPIDRLLEKRCARWAEERKLEPLQCLANASSRLKHSYVDIDVIHNSIIDIYDINNDCDGALAFFDSVSDEKSSQLAKRVEEMRNKSRAKI
ncbi:leucine-rich PPR motif-containing protein, mitochondrial isoform X2 [Dendroctonus ponderosae]|uniref:leucine-rich PPR motif-containing protein, mitochondrial isoform X2 n=1 Tax=Dendroctonus ponderosae TaxID=77166 RepID=UPI002034F380|nr:leucine-rich PPR motif-containing protein, mitochondrial isoform X2 [Dendroctonus ponderosae]